MLPTVYKLKAYDSTKYAVRVVSMLPYTDMSSFEETVYDHNRTRDEYFATFHSIVTSNSISTTNASYSSLTWTFPHTATREPCSQMIRKYVQELFCRNLKVIR